MLTLGIKHDNACVAGQIKAEVLLEYFHVFISGYFGSQLLKMKIAAQARDQIIALFPQTFGTIAGEIMAGFFTQVSRYSDTAARGNRQGKFQIEEACLHIGIRYDAVQAPIHVMAVSGAGEGTVLIQ